MNCSVPAATSTGTGGRTGPVKVAAGAVARAATVLVARSTRASSWVSGSGPRDESREQHPEQEHGQASHEGTEPREPGAKFHGRPCLGGRAQDVSDSPDGVEETDLVSLFQLLAEIADVDVHDIRSGVGLELPDGVEQLRLG